MNTTRSLKLFIIGVAIIFASIIPYMMAPEENTVIRAAIDIGSGSTKLRVAEVDLDRNRVVKMLVNKQFTVMYMRDLTSEPKGAFSAVVMDQGIAAIEEAKKIATEHGAKKIVALATAAFRKASNGEAFVKSITEKTGVPVFIVDQDLEGELAFKAALTQIYIPPHYLVVFDIGGGSMQLTSVDTEGNFQVYRGHEAVEPFKNFVIQNLQSRDLVENASPNPMNAQDVTKASEHYLKVANEVSEIFKEKILDPQTRVIGVGSVFAYGILPTVKDKNPVKVSDLTEAIYQMQGMNDEELGGEDFVEVKLTNAILIRSVMEALKIPEIKILDVNNADGAFFYEAFWAEEQKTLEPVNAQ